MPTAAISTLTYDPDGVFLLDLAGDGQMATKTVSRRATRTATLDGGAVVTDGGYSAGDRTIILRIECVSSALLASLQRIVQTYSSILLCMPDGAYLATPQRLDVNSSIVSMVMLVTGAGRIT